MRVTFPDIEALWKTTLAAATGTGYVRAPATLPTGEFFTVRRAGGTRDLLVDNPRVTVTAWGTDDPGAWQLAETLRSYSKAQRGAVIDGVQIYRVDEVSGLIPHVDESSGRPTYFFTHQLRLRGTVPA